MIRDLEDNRRLAKPWLPQDDRDVTNLLVFEGIIEFGCKPECANHGAMNRVDQYEAGDGSLTYRCSGCGVGAKYWSANHKEAKIAFRKEWDARVK